MSSVMELKEQRMGLVVEARKVLDNAKSEKRELTGEEQQKYDAIMADVDKLGDRIETEEREAYQSQVEQKVQKSERKLAPHKPGVSIEDNRRAYNQSLKNWFLAQSGQKTFGHDDEARAANFGINLHSRQLNFNTRALSVGTVGAGGYTVDPGFSNVLEEHMKWFSDLRNFVTVLNTSTGVDIQYPKVEDFELAIIVGENADLQQATDPVFTNVTLKAWKYDTKIIRISNELIVDSAFDMVSWLAMSLATRIARAQEIHMLVGTGTGQPQGIVTAASDSGITAASAAGPTADELLDLMFSVDRAYRQNGTFVFHDTSLSRLRRLKDQDGQYLWVPSLEAGVPNTFWGRPYVISNSMAEFGNNSVKPVVYGDLSKYIWRQVDGVEIRRSDERYFEFDQVAFVGLHRADGRYVGPSSALKYLDTPAA